MMASTYSRKLSFTLRRNAGNYPCLTPLRTIFPYADAAASRTFSSIDSPADAASVADAAKLKLKAAELKPNRILFPWRHEPSENLLPRLQFGTPEYLADVRLPNDVQGMLAFLFLKVPFWKVFFGTTWRNELAESSAFAFAQATAGIISNVYKIPFSSVNGNGDGSINFQFPVNEAADTIAKDVQINLNSKGKDEKILEHDDKASSSETGVEDEKLKSSDDKQAVGAEDGLNSLNDDAASSDTISNTENDLVVTEMLDKPLRRVFQSAHESGRDQLIVSLKSEPKRALLYTIFGVPFLTKARAEADTSLLSRIRDLLSLVREDPDTAFGGINDFIRQETAWGKSKMDTTIEMQVLVECEEQFQVRDRKTGVLLQGPEDGLVRTVMHLVRLETIVSWRGRFPSWPSRTQENWVVTDIDDLVGSQKWYHKR
ncbi:hypothetical protein MPSEU_000641500 [Mayamaea pseudoterrestris]|nr:hypothetical protein MPSEU_000641500 [Mayamaea pseudoterrestris]